MLAQLKLHSFLVNGSKVPKIPQVEDLDHAKLAPVLESLCRSFRESKGRSLQEGQIIKVFYQAQGLVMTRRGARPLEYECKLLNQTAEGNWNVAWKGDRTSTEPFLPIEDSWTLAE